MLQRTTLLVFSVSCCRPRLLKFTQATEVLSPGYFFFQLTNTYPIQPFPMIIYVSMLESEANKLILHDQTVFVSGSEGAVIAILVNPSVPNYGVLRPDTWDQQCSALISMTYTI